MGLIEKLDIVRPGDPKDGTIWSIDPLGVLTTLATFLKMIKPCNVVQTPLLLAVWKLKYPDKIKVFLWSLAQRGVNTHDHIQKRGKSWALSPSICSLCHKAAESLDHLFLHYPSLIEAGQRSLISLSCSFVLQKKWIIGSLNV